MMSGDTHPRAAAEERIVSQLANLMRAKLAMRRHHGDWRAMSFSQALARLMMEVKELRDEGDTLDVDEDPHVGVIDEAVDVAAYCAILIDVLRAEVE